MDRATIIANLDSLIIDNLESVLKCMEDFSTKITKIVLQDNRVITFETMRDICEFFYDQGAFSIIAECSCAKQEQQQ